MTKSQALLPNILMENSNFQGFGDFFFLRSSSNLKKACSNVNSKILQHFGIWMAIKTQAVVKIRGPLLDSKDFSLSSVL